MTRHTPLLILCTILFPLCFCGCGGNGSNCPNRVEFKLDGVQHSLYDCNDISAGSFFSDTDSSPLYQFLSSFATYPISDNISLHQLSNVPLETKNYSYTGLNPNERPNFLYILPGNEYMYSFSPLTSTGNVEFTQLEQTVGGTVKGTFSFQNIDYKDDNGNVISSGHTITDGVFEIQVDIVN